MTSVCPAAGPVSVDGRLTEPAWSLAVTAAELTVLGTKTAAPRLTTFRFLYGQEALFVGVECQTVTGGRRLMVKPAVREHDGPVFSDESVELYLQPDPGGPYYHFVANALGVQYEGRGTDATWDGAWTARTSESDLGWQLEAGIPYATLGLAGPPQPGAVWRGNVCRNDRTNQRYCTWAQVRSGFHEPQNFGALYFARVAVGTGPRRVVRQGKDLAVAVEVQSGAEPAGSLRGEIMIQTPAGRFDREAALSLGAQGSGRLMAVAEGAWVPGAQVAIGETLTLNDTLSYRAPLVTLAAADVRPERPSQPVPVEIGNGVVALTFDEGTGNLLSAENRPAGLRVQFGSTGTGPGAPRAPCWAGRSVRSPVLSPIGSRCPPGGP